MSFEGRALIILQLTILFVYFIFSSYVSRMFCLGGGGWEERPTKLVINLLSYFRIGLGQIREMRS